MSTDLVARVGVVALAIEVLIEAAELGEIVRELHRSSGEDMRWPHGACEYRSAVPAHAKYTSDPILVCAQKKLQVCKQLQFRFNATKLGERKSLVKAVIHVRSAEEDLFHHRSERRSALHVELIH